MSQTTRIQEFSRVTQAREVDEEKGILYDLVALGPTSASGREYPESVLRESLPLFNGKQSLANHAKGSAEPSVYDVLGVWENMRVEGGKVRGDFHYFKSHPLAPRLVEAARRPELHNALGFSIDGYAKTSKRNGKGVVESIKVLNTIDCVAQPGTVKGLYESRGAGTMKVREQIERYKVERPGWVRAIREMAEAGLMSPEAEMAPPPDTDSPSESGDHESAILDAAKAVLDDGGLSTAEKMQKIKKLLGIIDGGNSGGGGESKSESKAEESALRLENNALRKLAAKGVQLTPVVEMAIKGCTSDADVTRLVESLEGGDQRRGGQAVRAAAPQPGQGRDAGKVQESKVPEGRAEALAWLKN